MKHKGQKVPLSGVAEMLLCLSIGLLASAVAIAPMTLKAQEGSGEYQTRSPSDGAGLEPGPGTGVNNKPAPPDERLNEQKEMKRSVIKRTNHC